MKCHACGKEQSKKELLYTEEHQAYCVNPFTCNELHPNSVKNIVERGGAVKLYTEEELEKTAFERLDVPDEVKDRIRKIADKPQSIRLSKTDIAYYLIRLQEAKGLNSLSETIRYCVAKTMEVEPLDGSKQQAAAVEPEPEPEPAKGIVVSIGNKPVEPIKKQDKEEEFTF